MLLFRFGLYLLHRRMIPFFATFGSHNSRFETYAGEWKKEIWVFWNLWKVRSNGWHRERRSIIFSCERYNLIFYFFTLYNLILKDGDLLLSRLALKLPITAIYDGHDSRDWIKCCIYACSGSFQSWLLRQSQTVMNGRHALSGSIWDWRRSGSYTKVDDSYLLDHLLSNGGE